MPRGQNRREKEKEKEEHLIFVKNVPADVATGPLLDLFARYDPIRIKNVYPTSDITTVVMSFPTYDEACYAQEDTDGIRLENVVLRVEMFDKYRSVRYLREERNVKRPLGALGDYEEEVEVPPNYSLELEDTPPFAPNKPLRQADGTSTWAQIARKVHPMGMAPLPAPHVAPPVQPAVGKDTRTSTNAAVAIPHMTTGTNSSDAQSEAPCLDDTSLETLSVSSTGAVDLAKESPSGTIRTSLWAPIDSTETIRKRHCADCMFCQMRELLQADL